MSLKQSSLQIVFKYKIQSIKNRTLGHSYYSYEPYQKLEVLEYLEYLIPLYQQNIENAVSKKK